jgi:long-chain acyl-CoA synthetase
MNLNLATLLENAARQYPARTALIEGERKITYKELDTLASRVAVGMEAHGIGVGDTVALSSANTIEFVASFFGVLKTGASIMPLNFLLRAQEIRTQLEFSAASAYICQEDTGPLACGTEGRKAFSEVPVCKFLWLIGGKKTEDASESCSTFEELTNNKAQGYSAKPISGEQVAIVSFTSGTTGNPKAACVSHQSEYSGSYGTVTAYGYTKDDVLVTVVPLFTSIAQVLILSPMLSVGGCLVLLPRFDPASVLDAISRHRGTVFIGVPTMLVRLAQTGGDCTPLREHWRLVIYGGSPLLAESRALFQETVGVPLRQAYGLTEARFCAPSPADIGAYESPDALVPAMGYTFRIVDSEMTDVPSGEKGELVMRGPGIMLGYLNNPSQNEQTFQGTWFHTGDIAIQASDGAYYLVGRIKDVISRGGYKVYPADVEAVLRTHPEIADAAVLGVPHPEYGEEVAAALILKPGISIDLNALQPWLREALPPHQFPRMLRVIECLPMTPTGKVQKRELVGLFA